MLIAPLFLTTKNWKQIQMSINRSMDFKKMLHIYTKEYYSVIKWNELIQQYG